MKNKDNTTTNNDNNSDSNNGNISKKSKQWKRNILWFNPPFSKNVATKIGRYFVNLIDNFFETTNFTKFSTETMRKLIKLHAEH